MQTSTGETAALEYSSDPISQEWFVNGWHCFKNGNEPDPSIMNAWQYKYALEGWAWAKATLRP